MCCKLKESSNFNDQSNFNINIDKRLRKGNHFFKTRLPAPSRQCVILDFNFAFLYNLLPLRALLPYLHAKRFEFGLLTNFSYMQE